MSGPVLAREPKGYIGKENKVAIPAAYYRVILDLDEPETKAIGFLMDNEVSYEPLFNNPLCRVDEARPLRASTSSPTRCRRS